MLKFKCKYSIDIDEIEEIFDILWMNNDVECNDNNDEDDDDDDDKGDHCSIQTSYIFTI